MVVVPGCSDWTVSFRGASWASSVGGNRQEVSGCKSVLLPPGRLDIPNADSRAVPPAKPWGRIGALLSEENCSIYIESPANDRAEHGLRRSLHSFIYLMDKYRLKGKSDAEIS